jgi:cell division protein FtsB
MYQLLRSTLTTSRRNLRGLVYFAIAVVLLYMYVGGDTGLYQIWKQTRTVRTLREEIAEQQVLREQNLDEKARLERKDPGVIEKKAREDLGMVKKGEQVYLIIDEKDKP